MIKKGQVSTEYLVILAVVLVIALVVVYLVGGFSGLGAGSIETQSKNYWGSTAPFAITAFKASGTTLELEVRNNDLDRLVLTSVSGVGLGTSNLTTSFTSGQTQVVTVTLDDACGVTGTPFTYEDIVMIYNKGQLTGLAQAGTKPLVGKCS